MKTSVVLCRFYKAIPIVYSLLRMVNYPLITHIFPDKTDVVILIKDVIKERMVSLEGERR